LLYLLLCSFLLSSKTIVVGKNQFYKTLKSAVSVATSKDTILIESGVYKEGNIIISKSLVIIGKNKPEFDGESKFEIFTISAQKLLIKGITFKNSGYSSMNDYAAITVIDASDFEENTIINTSFAIHLSNCNHFRIINNVIKGIPLVEQNTGNGIHLWKCNNAHIDNNRISQHRDGIYFEFVTQSEIKNNYSTENIRYGLHFMFSNNDAYSNNTFSNNGAGVAVMFSHNVKMIGNNFQNNLGGSAYGILLKEISDGQIENNTFSKNTIGIYMEGTNRIKVNKNVFSNNGWAFRIQASCSDITVKQNNFEGNTFDIATNGTLVLNTFENNYWDKYEGYDMNKDDIGDVPFYPVSLFSMVTEQMPYAIMLYRSFMVMLLERTEKAIPSITPIGLVDKKPMMKPVL
jgi:nitrous oxidase accessory protein